jgi:segregation and condensation protein B
MASRGTSKTSAQTLKVVSNEEAHDDATAEGDRVAVELRAEDLRILEALLFAAAGPLDVPTLARHLPMGANVPALLAALQGEYGKRGINLVKIGEKWAFQTAADLGHVLQQHATEERRLSRAAMETLAIIAYHQPVTRAEIEEIRGVATSAGTLDVLMETGWVRPRARRRAPGRPLTYGTTERFLAHFSLETLKDLPGLNDLKGAGLLDANLPPDFRVPEPGDLAALMPDELPIDAQDPADVQEELDLEDDDRDDADGEERGGKS